MVISLLPTRLPDESLYSLVARIGWLNGLGSHQEACAFMFGNLDEERVGDAHADIENFCAVTRNVYGQLEALVDSATTLPFFRRLGTDPRVASAHGQIAQSNVVDTSQRGLGLAALSNGYAHIWRWCPVCSEENTREHGMTYWHRSHQLPGVVVCTKHRMSLLEVNLPYRMRQQYFVLPSRIPEHLERLDSCPINADLDLALQLALFAENILHDTSQGNSADTIQGAVLDGLVARGLVNKGGKIPKRELVEDLSTCFGPISLNEFISPLVNEQHLMRLASALTTTTQVRPALLNLILIYWLFGSWALFLEYCAWRKALGPSGGAPVTPKKPNSDISPIDDKEPLRRSHRRVCLSYLQHHFDATKSDFWRAHPRSCRWLTLHDRGWIDQHLPTAVSYRGRQLQLF